MNRFRILRIALLSVLGSAMVLAGFGAFTLVRSLHTERTVIPDLPGTRLVQLHASDGTLLKAAWLQPAAEPKLRLTSTANGAGGRCVLFLHGVGGWRGRSQRMAPALLANGYSILAPDSRAHGESGGDTVSFGIREQYDALAWAHWMRENGCGKIYGLGESMGASVLIMASALEPAFSAMAVEGSFANLLDMAELKSVALFPLPSPVSHAFAKLAVWGGQGATMLLYGFDFRQVSPIDSIRHNATPILLIHGTADSRTPPMNSEELAAANPATTTLWLVPGAKHVGAFTTAPEEFKTRVLAFFAGH